MPDVAHGFQIHPGQESWTVVDALLDDLASGQPGWRVGSTLHLPRRRLPFWTKRAGDWNAKTSFLLADPESTRMDRPFSERGHGRKDFEYLSESDPSANRDRFVANVLAAQREAGAGVLISPWFLHGTSQTEHELAATIGFAQRAQTLVEPGTRLLMGVEATDRVFATAEARNAMVNELVEGPELPVYLRMRTSPPAGYSHYQQEAGLAGLRDVVRALEGNDRPVALPQSGLTGWLMCAFGARSFGAGIAGSMQRNCPPPSGGGGFPPLHWYFLPQLLGFVQAEEVPAVAALEGFESCACPYCAGSLPTLGAGFDSERAGKHFLWWCARLASELDAAGPAVAVTERVRSATVFAETVNAAGVHLDTRSQPSHLPVWGTILAG